MRIKLGVYVKPKMEKMLSAEIFVIFAAKKPKCIRLKLKECGTKSYLQQYVGKLTKQTTLKLAFARADS